MVCGINIGLSSVSLLQNFSCRRTDSRGNRQGQNQQREDNAEGDIEAAKDRRDNRTADAANTKP